MNRKYHNKIVNAFKPREYVTYCEIMNRIGVKPKTTGLYYRAWQDLETGGRFDRGINHGMYQVNTYRINQ